MWIFMNYDNSIIIVSFENGFYRIVYENFFVLYLRIFFFWTGELFAHSLACARKYGGAAGFEPGLVERTAFGLVLVTKRAHARSRMP
jgi:hypothetical protein